MKELANKAFNRTSRLTRRYLKKTTNSAPECSVEKKRQKTNQEDDK